MMIQETLYEQALQTSSPAAALRAVVTDLSAQGYQKAAIYESLERFLVRLRREGVREDGEDAVLDVLDALTDWCHPGARLLPGDDSLAGQGR